MLRHIARELDADADALIAIADLETGLGAERLRGELARTSLQLRHFATVAQEGGYLDARIDPYIDPATADPQQVAAPDLRRMLIPIGPVAIFTAGNFPLAFGVAGTDAASALAVGCPVVVKGHPGHPGTSQRCASAVQRAMTSTRAPAGVFALLQGAGHEIGRQLTLAPEIEAVAFTGSLRGGRALYDLAASRARPIPVYAEMGSTNPVVISSGAAASRCSALAEGFAASMMLGAGQFCTKPGLVFVPHGPLGDAFVESSAALLRTHDGGVMLSLRLRDQLRAQVSRTRAAAAVQTIVGADAPEPDESCRQGPALFQADASTLRATPALLDEHFGPVALLVRYRDVEDLMATVEALPGSLSATIHVSLEEDSLAADLRDTLMPKVGRLLYGGWPTGVAVTHAMQHGGPYPASTASAHTSVGSAAVLRFLRPVAFQDFPQHLLPDALRDHDPPHLPVLRAGARLNPIGPALPRSDRRP